MKGIIKVIQILMLVKKRIKSEFIFHTNFLKFVNLIDPPIKDTVSVPANGYVIIRFEADNPGAYLCVIIV